ncbi:histidine kinase dimerization/phospho-acceptor domain-containing protein [Bifidobacterium longum]|uniref:histidine kinase n=2 Tax=Bifidobacterium TaxID=1678 RepID=A0AAW9CF55_BIFLN|nr:histidine kinase dimerization/phospho-acceptor domain-containing protein [Bifidobacterium longum]MDW7545377.1 histidine kinase dimerization/phospho-acceptor domain-containing protein [Bifidobacterium longum]MDW7580845.1 histidine kinase dimerization/phospho-acceptor domain-containing protein [Bifidobacterium longum]
MFADFNTMVEELGGIETMKNDFVSNVSHEIRNPLAAIKNYATMMRDMDMDKAQREECVRTIISASERLNALVTNTSNSTNSKARPSSPRPSTTT